MCEEKYKIPPTSKSISQDRFYPGTFYFAAANSCEGSNYLELSTSSYFIVNELVGVRSRVQDV